MIVLHGLERIVRRRDMFEQTLRKPHSDYFKEFLEGVRVQRRN